LLDRPRHGERCLLLHVGVQHAPHDDEKQEFRALAESAGATVLGELQAWKPRPDPRFFVGSGKAEELAQRVQETGAELLLVSRALSPSQERNLEDAVKVRVLDRNGLILDIFAQRAASFEGQLQVELAQLEHLATRLVRGWSHLERQKGGIGLRGPGETQLETDRRLIGRRIRSLRARLERVERQHAVSRKERLRQKVPVVALVGYTNAGKTTLFNRLSGASALARDQLFATLDPTLRRLDLPGGDQVVLVDTVGFVRDLPHELVAAFRATLQETREASLLLHVIDASDPYHEERREQVEKVLREVGADQIPRLDVYNKIDRLPADQAPPFAADGNRIFVSAVAGTGLDPLVARVAQMVVGSTVARRVTLSPRQSRLRARLFDSRAVRGEHVEPDGGWTLDLELSQRRWAELCAEEGLHDSGARNA
jgi:GTP-binding protein HflX